MARTAQLGDRSCGDRTVALPVLAGGSGQGPIRRSRSGRRRAIVLAAVQALMIVHIVVWLLSREFGWFGGRTTTPIEPSESMEFVKHGVVNAGLIFFVLALLSTLVLGRWFCGWGCHLVLLQDGCGWLMKRAGIRPRPFRSRLLVYVPLVLALYMFVWPAAFRLGFALFERMGWVSRTLPHWELSWHLTTTDFWRTFAGVVVAIPFLGICGFAAVYFLGAKGFCTYGCPYGGFFAPVDKISPGRIRVTDACEHCGHCTAVCTSNVRVHEEVREYGMVVDPGCMKCLDCVSVCPNDALHFGFGRPAVARGAPRHAAPRRKYDLTWPEELALVAVFVASFAAVRGVYGIIPMLMAAGSAGCTTFLVWKTWRMLWTPNVSFQRRRLKYRGRVTRAGAAFVGVACAVGLLTIHSGVVNGARRLAEHHDDQVTIGRDAALSGQVTLPEDMRRHAERGRWLYRLASGFTEGGLGFPAPWQKQLDMRIAWLHVATGRLDEAESVLRHAIERDGLSDLFCSNLATVLRAAGRGDDATGLCRDALLEEPGFHRTLDEFMRWAPSAGAMAIAVELCEARRQRFPDDLPTARWLARIRRQAGDLDEAVSLFREVVAKQPTRIDDRMELAGLLIDAERLEEALVMLEETRRMAPGLAPAHLLTADVLARLGQRQPAFRALEDALAIAGGEPMVHLRVATILATMGQKQQARQAVQTAVDLAPDDPRVQ
ncbi:MAG: tetratricopeptide repeat protein, partial [Planctomycetota bacterium]